MSDARHPLTIGNFRAYFISRLFSTIAISAQAMVIGWQVYGIARQTMGIKQSAFLLGMIGLVQFVPLFLLTPVVGLVADTYDRRWIARGTTALLMVNAAVLGMLTYLGDLTVWALFVAAAFVGIARAFSGPAFSALAPNLVPREVLPTAIAVSSIAWQAGTIAGPSLGGVLYAIHPDFAYASISALLLISLVLLFLIGKVPQPPVQKNREPLQRIKDGFAYVRNNRLVLATITLDLFVVLLAGATALLPVFARDILHVGAAGNGLLRAAPGVGAVVVGACISTRPLRRRVGGTLFTVVALFGAFTVVFGLSRSFVLSLLALAALAGADMISMVVRSTL
ncbi:MAG: MFS transporter, partial [Tsuneonella sp.]